MSLGQWAQCSRIENLFGKGHEDGWAAVRWVGSLKTQGSYKRYSSANGFDSFQLHEHGHEINGDGTSISVGGISAGGAIAAVVQQLARDAGISLKLGECWPEETPVDIRIETNEHLGSVPRSPDH